MASVDPFFHDPAGHFLRLPRGCVKLCTYHVGGPVTWREAAYFRRLENRDELWVRHNREGHLETRRAVVAPLIGEAEDACARLLAQLCRARQPYNWPTTRRFTADYFSREEFEAILAAIVRHHDPHNFAAALQAHARRSEDQAEVRALLAEFGVPTETSLHNRLERLKESYRDRIPADILDRVADALLPTPGQHPYEGLLLCGNDHFSDSLILLPVWCFEVVARQEIAVQTATTWGDFYEKAGPSLASSVQDLHTRRRGYADFDEFCAARLEEHPHLSRRHLLKDWNSERFGPLPPALHEPFDREFWYDNSFEHDLACPDSRVTALDVLPITLMREFGKVECGSPLGGGDFLFLPRERKDDIVAAAAKIGYVVVEDQVLVNAACLDLDAKAISSNLRMYRSLAEFIQDVKSSRQGA